MENVKNVVTLNDSQLQDVDGGNPVGIIIGVIGLGVALFKVGYDIGRDMAQNGW